MGRRKIAPARARAPSRGLSTAGDGVVSGFAEIREKHKLELENLTLTKHPFRTLHFFMLAMLQYLERLATYILSKGALFVVLIVLVVAPGLFLAVTDGLHKKTMFIISLCNNQLLYLMEKELIWIFGHIPGFSAALPSVIAKLHSAKEKYLAPPVSTSPSSQMEWNFSFTLVWNTAVWLVLVNFFVKIVTSTAQEYLRNQQDIEMELITDSKSF